jgi:hypothetical protein
MPAAAVICFIWFSFFRNFYFKKNYFIGKIITKKELYDVLIIIFEKRPRLDTLLCRKRFQAVRFLLTEI